MDIKVYNNRLVWPVTGGFATVGITSAGAVELQIYRDQPFAPWAPVLKADPALLPLTAEASGEGTIAHSHTFTLRPGADGGLVVEKAGKIIFAAPTGFAGYHNGLTHLRFSVGREEIIQGLGQDPMANLNVNGHERRMWNQWGGKGRSGNCGVGMFTSSAGWGMLLANSEDARFRFNEAQPPELDPLGEAMVPSKWTTGKPLPANTGEVEVRAKAATFYILSGSRVDMLRQYYQLTGFASLPPKWAFGLIQCKNRYMNRAGLEHVANEYRRRGIPCDALVIDWLWFEEFGDLEWREDDWPDAAEMLHGLAEKGYRVLSAQHPFVSENSRYYSDFVEKGYLNKVPKTKRITWDHTNPAASEHWWQKTAKLYKQGLRGYWIDMGELEEHFDGTESHLGRRDKTHNAYTLFWARGLYEGQKRDFGTRGVLLARSGAAGMQKYGNILWSGDIDARWQVLRRQVRTGVATAMSGVPYWTTDIGGFLTGPEFTPELYTRWMEWGVLCSIFRTHGTRPGNEPWSFGAEVEATLTGLIRLRYRLLPYIYSLAIGNAVHGDMLMQSLACAYEDDTVAAALEDEFLLGSSLLAAPVTTHGARVRRVYLPKGQWHHWWSGKVYPAGWHTIVAPLGQMPLFVKAGSILPTFASIGETVDACSGLELLTFPGADGTFTFYDDEGEGFGYQNGNYSQCHFVYDNSTGDVTAQAVKGEVPVYTTKPFAPQQSKAHRENGWAFDADQAANGTVTLTFTALQAGLYPLSLTAPEGYSVTSCSEDNPNRDMYEPRYPRHWAKETAKQPGETIRWQLTPTGDALPLALPEATLAIGQDVQTVSWEGRYLSRLAVLASFAVQQGDSLDTLLPPDEDPHALAYRDETGKATLTWQRDALFAGSPFGYLDFRRFGVHQFGTQASGEEISGIAYARENLYAEQAGNAPFILRHDGPLELLVNGQSVYKSKENNCVFAEILLPLTKGVNQLVCKQFARVARPYSGGEFGFSLKFVGADRIWQLS